jgi:AAA+ superfamily predicted ATPase
MPEVKLKVMEALQEEAYKGIIRIDSQTMRDLGVKVGDILEIEGGRVTVGIIDRAYPTDVGQEVIRMDGILRRNAKTSIGEVVVVRSTEVKEAKKVTIAPAQPGVVLQIEPVSRIKMGLLGRPIMKGDQVALGGFRRRRRTFEGGPFEDIFSLIESDIGLGFGLAGLKLIVVNTQPKSPVIITENTEITINPHSVEMVEEKVVDVTYEDIGGLDDELKKIREMIEIPLKHPEIFERLGIEPPKGVLLYGAPGTGKTLLAKAVTNETNAHFIHLDSPSVMSKFVGEAEKRIREIFEEAEKNSPSIIFIDEIDAIAPKREESYGEVERRVVAQLLCLDKNTKIYLLNKDIKIKELFDTVEGEIFVDEFGVEYKLPKDEVLVQGVDSEGKLTTTRIISLTKTQILKAYNVKLSNGSEIKTSKITKFLVINNEGVDWVPANEITKGQYVLVPKKINFDSAIHKIDLMSLNEKTKWVAKLPTDGVLNKIFGRNYALLSEINDLIIYKKIKVRTSKKRGDLRDKV